MIEYKYHEKSVSLQDMWVKKRKRKDMWVIMVPLLKICLLKLSHCEMHAMKFLYLTH